MNRPFRTRRFEPVPPELRPRRHRSAARVVITDATSVLLLADTDPGLPGSRWWTTPGGGIDPGETPLQAALREVEEETGLRAEAELLRGPVAHRLVVHGYSDQILSQDETFFVLALEAQFEVNPAGLTEDERVTLSGWAWLPLAGLDRLDTPVWPANLADLVALSQRPDAWPADLGVVEESTLALG